MRARAQVFLGLLGVGVALILDLPAVQAAPVTVTVAGSFQSEAGCAGDWQPDCAATHMAYDASDDVWQLVLNLPAGSYEYKVALNDSWDVNYGRNAVLNGANIPLDLAGPASVKFYYDDKTHWITDNRSSVIAVVPGNFQSEIGCPGDWQPDCLRSWLQDPDGDGVYSALLSGLPPGPYEAKVAHNESWDQNYGTGGVPNGPNIPFQACGDVAVSYAPETHILSTSTGPCGPAVPEPPSLLLLGTGLVGLATAALRRRSSD